MSSLAAGGILVTAGALCLVRTMPDFVRGVRSRRWPRVPATIERVEYAVKTVGQVSRMHPFEIAADWLVIYRYTLPNPAIKGGHSREGHRLRFGPVSSWYARRCLAKLAPGQAAHVAVDPGDHEQSVLVAGPGWESALAVSAGAATILAGFVWLLA